MKEFSLDAYQLARYIKDAKKKTPMKLFLNGNFRGVKLEGVKQFGCDNSLIIFGELSQIEDILEKYQEHITDYVMEYDRRNSAIPLLDYRKIDARIEPGAVIREHVEIGKNAIIMMGAVINIGAKIGEKTMIDMNAVVGSRAIIGKNCHIGAGCVIAGVIEPPSKEPVIIEDNVLIGANAVILEGVHIGNGAVVAAGAVVLEDVSANMVVAGSPAKIIKAKDDQTTAKTKIIDDLRK